MRLYLLDFITGILFSVVIIAITALFSGGNAGDTLGSLLFGSILPSGTFGLLLFPVFELIIPSIIFLALIKTYWKNPVKKDHLRLIFFILGGYLVYIAGIVGFFVTFSPDIL